MRLRLLVTSACMRSCPGCCNKDWDVDSLPQVQSFEGYDEIMLTGGEPLLYVDLIVRLIAAIRERLAYDDAVTPIYVYTAETDPKDFLTVLTIADGMTLTLHDQKDVDGFLELNRILLDMGPRWGKSLRLNIFAGVHIPDDVDLGMWKLKTNIEWIENCPLPEGEVFMRI